MDRPLRRVCVYCASSLGTDPKYRESATRLGEILAEHDVGLVYGGGAVGLMGTIADAAMGAGAEVIGVIPTALFSREIGHSGLTELIEVGSMHERKAKMFDLSDAFVALPGGLGTLEELFEVATWSQLGTHDKPVVVVDVDGYYTPLFDFIDGAVAAGLMREKNRQIIVRVERVEQVMDALSSYSREHVQKWLDLDET